MKLKIDSVFEDFPYLFCDEFDQGYQVFSSWNEFLNKLTHALHKDRPEYVYKATITKPENSSDPVIVHVDIGELVEVPWAVLEEYL